MLTIKAEGVAAALGALTGYTPTVLYAEDESGNPVAYIRWDEGGRVALRARLGPVLDSMTARAYRPSPAGPIRVQWEEVVGPVLAERSVPYAGLIALGVFTLGVLVGRRW